MSGVPFSIPFMTIFINVTILDKYERDREDGGGERGGGYGRAGTGNLSADIGSKNRHNSSPRGSPRVQIRSE